MAKIGRPTNNPKSGSVNIRLDEECIRILSEKVKTDRVTRAEWIRRGIKMLDKWGKPDMRRCKKTANYMAEVAELLGVELEEPFKITDNANSDNSNFYNYYRLSKKNGVETSCNRTKWVRLDGTISILCLLMIGDLRIIKLS